VVEIEGVGTAVKAFKATSRWPQIWNCREDLYHRPPLDNPIIAVAIEQHNLKPKQWTRVFVVERKDCQQQP
jgi:hypothetical protein